MKKRSTRFLSSLLLLCMISSMFCAFAAAANDISDDSSGGNRSSLYLDDYMAAVNPVSNGKLVITVDVGACRNCTQLGSDDIYLYESTDGVHFTLVRHYEYQDYPNMMGSGWNYYRDAVTYQGTVGRYYFASVYVYAADASGSDRRLYDTSIVRAHS